MNKINKQIPLALKAIKSEMANEDGDVQKEYKGYVSSMGASILQSGLIATLAFYSNESSGSKADRNKLLNAIRMIIAPLDENKRLFDYVLEKIKPDRKEKYRVDDFKKEELYLLQNQISDALISLKLALRTFKFTTE